MEESETDIMLNWDNNILKIKQQYTLYIKKIWDHWNRINKEK